MKYSGDCMRNRELFVTRSECLTFLEYFSRVLERTPNEETRPDSPSINIIGEIPEEKVEFVMSSGRLRHPPLNSVWAAPRSRSTNFCKYLGERRGNLVEHSAKQKIMIEDGVGKHFRWFSPTLVSDSFLISFRNF